jgi:hypothetical protein
MKSMSIWFPTLALALGVASCSCTAPEREPAKGSPSVTRVAEPEDVIDEELMIALAQAKNFHHKAKVYMTDAKPAEAIASVREILSLRFPAGAPEAEDVRLDARALLAKLLVSQGQLDDAMRTVDEGLALVQRETFFVANLYTVQGEIHEVRAANFDSANDKARAIDERRAAIRSYDRSIQINAAIQKKLMEKP